MENPDFQVEQERKEQFAHLYAMGTPIPEALRIVGYKVTSVDFGHRLLREPAIIALVDATRAWAVEKLVVTKNQLLEMVQRDRDLAYEMKNPAAATAASNLIGKILGVSDPATRLPSRIIYDWGGREEEIENTLEYRTN